MKTYKEMAERVLSRRDEYEERKQRRRKTAGSVSVSVFASLVLVVSMILGPMFGTLLKKPTPASPVTDASSNETAETRSVSTEEQTDDITAETTGEQTTTETESGTMLDESDTVIRVPEIQYINAPDYDIKIDTAQGKTLYGYKSDGDVMICTIRYSNTSYFLEQQKGNENKEHGNHVKICIVPSDNIELVSPDFLILDTPKATADFSISFRFKKAGSTCGSCDIFYIEDTNEFYGELHAHNDINEFIRYLDQKNGMADRYVGHRSVSAVRIKGYDFFATQYYTSWMYGDFAEYFGDVDENGDPLFLKDPYMPEYYDNPTCINYRGDDLEEHRYVPWELPDF